MGNKCYASSKKSGSLFKTKTYFIPKNASKSKDGYALTTETKDVLPLKFVIVVDKIKCKSLSQV